MRNEQKEIEMTSEHTSYHLVRLDYSSQVQRMESLLSVFFERIHQANADANLPIHHFGLSLLVQNEKNRCVKRKVLVHNSIHLGLFAIVS